MARTKYSERFCGYCNKATRMEFVGEMEGALGKMWFRCTRCHHTNLITVTTVTEPQAELNAASATPYSPLSSFTIGQAIFHPEWNDVGRVMSKMKTSDGNQSIMVTFEKQGQRRLIENLKPEPALTE
jgi:hypothetical protein